MKIPNITKHIPNAISQKVGRAALHVSKQSPHLLFGVGVVGVVATIVMASKATLKLEETLEETRVNLKAIENAKAKAPGYSDQDAKADTALAGIKTVKALSKLYGPTALVGVASIGCLTGAHIILNKRNVALTALYKASEKAFKEYRDRVEQKYGPDKEQEIRYDAIPDPENKGKKIAGPYGSSQYARFFDEFNPNWQGNGNYNKNFLRAQQQFANDMLLSRGHVFLNDIYDALGMDRCAGGAIVGWVLKDGNENHIDFGIFDSDSESARRFVNGLDHSILLDFNVDGVVFEDI